MKKEDTIQWAVMLGAAAVLMVLSVLAHDMAAFTMANIWLVGGILYRAIKEGK